jgi:drug/metabolite transporter (DMT)-like permease
MWVLLLFTGIIWGATFSLAKIAADGGGHPLGINYWQALIGAFVLLVIGLVSGQFSKIKSNQIPFYLTCGVLGTVIPGTLFYYAASRVSPGVLSITVATVPLMTVVAAVMLGVEKLQASRILGVVFGIVSIFLLVGPEESLPDPAAIPWVFVALLSAVCYSAESLVLALRTPAGITTITIAAGMYIAAALIMTPLVIFSGTFVPLAWPLGDVEWAIITLAVCSVAAYSLYIVLIINAGPVFGSQTAYVVTISGVIWGILIFDEHHSIWLWASVFVMMLALFLVRPAGR